MQIDDRSDELRAGEGGMGNLVVNDKTSHNNYSVRRSHKTYNLKRFVIFLRLTKMFIAFG